MHVTNLRFQKVSLARFSYDMGKFCPLCNDNYNTILEQLQLPCRATTYSAGYDFYCPYDITLVPDRQYFLPTGIKMCGEPTDDDLYTLFMLPRSSMGIKNGLTLSNTAAVIDADYCDAANEGHIILVVTVDRITELHAGDRFVQGLIVPVWLTADDQPRQTKRVGGCGSTGLK